MGFLYVILIIIGIAMIFCFIGLTLSIKNRTKEKKLQAAADYNFSTRNGSYQFKYMVKGFGAVPNKKIKIVINPVLGFSDLTTSSTNMCNKIIVHVTGAQNPLEQKQEFNVSSLNPNVTLELRSDLNNSALKIEVESIWTLGGNTINEKLDFNYSK